ncbi:hypothetical protein [Fusobacterium sp. PH5-44]|uniref:hypothetical protein n=1 Tax=Fusobacterium sp. PH5-44 TaxID=2940518 RepID=UPI003D25A97A
MISSAIFIVCTFFSLAWKTWRHFSQLYKAEVTNYDFHRGYTVKIKIHDKYVESEIMNTSGPDVPLFSVGSFIDVYCLSGVPIICYLTKRNHYTKNIIALIFGICWFLFAYLNSWIF